MTYRPDVDGLRAVSILFVLAFHADPEVVRCGFIGVDIFFVISGFLITSIVRSDLEEDRFSALLFYARRCRRILPALLVVLAAVWAYGRATLLPRDFTTLGRHLSAAAAFVSNMILWSESGYFDQSALTKPLLHLWSLAVEEQFYLVWPLLLVLAHRWNRSRGPLITVALVGLLSLASNLPLERKDPSLAFFLFPARAWELALGCALALIPVDRAAIRRPLRRNLLAGAGFGMLAGGALLLQYRVLQANAWGLLLPTCGAALVIRTGPATWVSRVLSCRPLVAVGLISYPLYLWHWPILSFLRMNRDTPPTSREIGLCLATAAVLAVLTRELLERPLQARLPIRPSSPRLSRAVAACGVASLALLAILGGLTAQGHLFTPRQELGHRLETYGSKSWPIFRGGKCFLGDPSQTARDFSEECLPHVRARGPAVLAWGDSYGATLFKSLEAVLDESGGTLTALASTQCPPVLGISVPSRPHCSATNDFVLEQIERGNFTTVILAANWLRSYFERTTEPTLLKIDRTAEILYEAGVKRIVVAGQVPLWREPLNEILMRHYLMRGIPLPKGSNEWIVPGVFEVDRELREHFAGGRTTYVSLLEIACPLGRCGVTVSGDSGRGDLWTFDSGHPTFEAANLYVDRLRPFLLPASE